MSILDDLPEIISSATNELLFYDALLWREGVNGGSAYDPEPGPPQTWPCRALETEWSSSVRAGGLVATADRQLIVLATTLPEGVVPQDGDALSIKGKTFLLVADGGSMPAVSSDPANATYTCRGRQ